MNRFQRSLRTLSCTLLAGLASAAGAAPAYEVVLATGARIPASSRPLVAMGKVSFLDESRRPVTLASADVNVEATRSMLSGIPATGKVWDEKSLAKLDRAKVQFYGEEAAATSAPGDVATTEDEPKSDMAPIDRLRTRIDTLGTKIRVLPTSDRQRSLMVIQQLELQQELSRLLDQPAPRG